MKRLLVVLAVLAALIGAVYWAGPSPSQAEAALVLGDMLSGAKGGLLQTLTLRPERQTVTWSVDGRRHSGDLYLPGEKAKAGLVLVPGAAAAGKDDPRLVALANTLARARFLVLVPDIAGMRTQEISPNDRFPIADAARFLLNERHQPGVGLVAISYGDVPAILAARDVPQVDFIVAVGGLHDMTALITFFTTGAYRETPDQPWQHGTPNVFGKWAFVKVNAQRLDDSGDRAMLAAIAQRKMSDPAATLDDLTAKLGPQGKAVMALMDNADPDRVPALMAALPQRIRADIAAIDLAKQDLSGLKAKLFLIHGRDDSIIPWTESAALARHAPQAELTLLETLAHADLKPGGWGDALALWRTLTHVLEARDRLGQAKG